MGASAPILRIPTDRESTTTYPPGIGGSFVESLRVTGPFEQLKMDEEPPINSDQSPGLWRSERDGTWLRGQNLRTSKSTIGDYLEPRGATSLHPGPEIENDLPSWGGSGGKGHCVPTPAIGPSRVSSFNTGNEENRIVVRDGARRRPTSMRVARLDHRRKRQSTPITHLSPLVERTSSDPTPMQDFSQPYPGALGGLLPLSSSASLPPPKELTSCSECKSILDTIRYVCSTCKEKDPKSLEELRAFMGGNGRYRADGRSDSGYELCAGCLEFTGLHHALEMSLGPGSSPLPASPEDVLSTWRRTRPNPKGNFRHAYVEKGWGRGGWQDVREYCIIYLTDPQPDSRTSTEQDDLADNRCSTCNTLLASRRYKCASCVQFNLCRACYR